MSTRAIWCATWILLGCLGIPGAVQAQSAPAATDLLANPIGKITSLAGSATVEHTAVVVVQAALPTTSQAKVDTFVYQGDVVRTEIGAKLSMTFADGTTFNLSGNTRVVLNEFIYDPQGTSNSTLFSVVQGTVNFVAGKVAKTGNMRLDTAVATMGIRGTTPRIEVAEDGTVTFDTLVEDKDKLEAALKAPGGGGERAPGRATTPDQTSPDNEYRKTLKRDFNICRGC